MKILLGGLHVEHYVQDRLLLNINRLKTYQNDRIGLIGKNGSEKTTLLHILCKKTVSEEGIMRQFSHCELIPQLKLIELTRSSSGVARNYVQQAPDKNSELLPTGEPTTNLDNNYIEKLEQDLKNWHEAFIMTSHDRAFLDNLCTTTWKVDEGKVTEYKGDYSSYVEQKELEGHREEPEYEEYEKEKKRLEKAINIKKQKAQWATKKPKNLSSSESKIEVTEPYFTSRQKKLRRTIKSLKTRLKKFERVERGNEFPPLKMDLMNPEDIKDRTMICDEDVSDIIEGWVL